MTKEEYINLCEQYGLIIDYCNGEPGSAWYVGVVPDNYIDRIKKMSEVCRYCTDYNHNYMYIGIWPCRIEDGSLLSRKGQCDKINTIEEFKEYLSQQVEVFSEYKKLLRKKKIEEL